MGKPFPYFRFYPRDYFEATPLHEEILRLVVQLNLDVLFLEPFENLADLQAENLDEIGLGE